MYFTEYVVTDKVANVVDPLGFMRPAGVLASRMFSQFTVLFNHPAYVGVLCAILQVMAERQLPLKRGFSLAFRRAEVLWGLAQAAADRPVLNIRRYGRLVESLARSGAALRLRDIAPADPLFTRLGYGTLGHYLQPCVQWGWVVPDGRSLTAAGHALADAASFRAGLDLRDALRGWLDGDAFDIAQLVALGQAFALDTAPSTAERRCWRERIEDWVGRHPTTAPLWRDPLGIDDLQGLARDAQAHANGIAALPQRYPTLAASMRALADFETLAGVAQFAFDLQLAQAQFDGDQLPPLAPGLLATLAAEAGRLAGVSELLRDRRLDAGGLFASIAVMASQPDALPQVVLRHHVAHQRAKGVAPLIDECGLRLKDRVDRDEFAKTLEELVGSESTAECLRQLAFRSRRDWHLRRCRQVHDWAYGATRSTATPEGAAA